MDTSSKPERRSKAGKHRGKSEEVRNDRRPHSLMKNRGRPKKGGGGGKHTWGRPGVDDMYDDDIAIDRGDPNYDSDENDSYVLMSRYDSESNKASKVGVPLSSEGRLGYGRSTGMGSPPRNYEERAAAGAGGAGAGDGESTRLNLSGFKRAVIPLIAEYFDSEDAGEVKSSVLDLGTPFFHYELVKRAVTMSMDKSDRERELASRLISNLYPDVLPMDQVGKGFERLFELADDLELDNPDAHKMLAQFLGRAVVDEILPPSFLSDPVVEDLGGEIVRDAKVLLSMRHGSARLEKVWGAAAGETSDLKQAVRMLVKEYFLSNDAAEAARCVRELSVPHFHHEVVKRTVVVALDRNAETQARARDLLAYLAKQGVISPAQNAIGFTRVKQELGDISLDQPQAPELFEAFVAAAKEGGYLASDWTGDTPAGDGGTGDADAADGGAAATGDDGAAGGGGDSAAAAAEGADAGAAE